MSCLFFSIWSAVTLCILDKSSARCWLEFFATQTITIVFMKFFVVSREFYDVLWIALDTWALYAVDSDRFDQFGLDLIMIYVKENF